MRRLAPALVLLVCLGVLPSCSNYSGNTRHQIAQWANGATYAADNAQIESDLGNLDAGYRLRQLKPLRTACDAFIADVSALYGTLPTPDMTLTDELNEALTTFANAGQDCFSAPSFSSARFKKYLVELASATATYAKAQHRLASFGVR